MIRAVIGWVVGGNGDGAVCKKNCLLQTKSLSKFGSLLRAHDYLVAVAKSRQADIQKQQQQYCYASMIGQMSESDV